MESKKIWLIIILLIGIAAIFMAAYYIDKSRNTWVCENNEWVKRGNPSSLPPSTGCGGEPVEQNNDVGLANPASVFCLEKGGQVEIRKDAEGGEYGVCIFENKKECEEWAFFRGECSAEEEVIYETKIISPASEQLIVSPLKIQGEMPGNWYFEANAIVEIYDSNGKLLGFTNATALDEWMTTSSVPFKAELTFLAPETATGILVLKNDNASGLPEHEKKESHPIVFGQTVKVFYSNNIKDPEFIDCTNVYSVDRVVEKTSAVGRIALEELLKGPTDAEKTAGYLTSINDGVKINSLIIEGKTAIVDFDESIEKGVGGSCRVTAIRAQITQTLKQFPTVDEVVISVNGRIDDALQP
jgi:putative hemolysin